MRDRQTDRQTADRQTGRQRERERGTETERQRELELENYFTNIVVYVQSKHF